MDSFWFNLGYLGGLGLLCFSWPSLTGKHLGLELALAHRFPESGIGDFCWAGLEVAAINKIPGQFRNLFSSM
jgi:hypothetical protein